MIDSSVFQSMSDYASLGQNDAVLDIGAGLGFLTNFLSNKCKKVLAVELDDELVKILREQFDMPNVEIVEGNVLGVKLSGFNKVVSIPPYHISSRLIVWLFSKSFDRAVLIFQREFARRLVAIVGAEDYGWQAVLAYYHAECELLDDIPRSMFYPQPEVDSVILRLTPKQTLPFNLRDEILFMKMLKSAFTQRNRKIRNALVPFLENTYGKSKQDAIKIASTLPFRERRVREMAPEDFGALVNALEN